MFPFRAMDSIVSGLKLTVSLTEKTLNKCFLYTSNGIREMMSKNKEVEGLSEFLEDQLRKHHEEVQEIQELQKLMELLPKNQGFYFIINVVANSD